MIFFPWYPALLLAVESSNVIDLRMRKVALSSPDEATAEVRLMMAEKLDAAVTTAAIIMLGGSASEVVSHYRDQVAENAARLSR